MKYTVSLLLLLSSFSVFAQKNYYLLAGTYTRGKSTGIYVYDFDGRDGSARIVDSVQTSNPSYLAVAPDQKEVYAVSEVVRGGNSGQVKAFSFNRKTGHLSLVNGEPSMGDNPCYIAVDKTGKWVFVGNYTSGTLALLPIEKNGRLGTPITSFAHKGHGPNPDRQEGPHVHSTVISPDNRWLFVPDLGVDSLVAYAFDAGIGSLKRSPDHSVKLADGSGPRHFDFHPNKKWAYLIQEMAGTITAFSYSKGRLKVIQTISTLPPGYAGTFTSADVHVSRDGKFLYASNRDSSNTIAIFRIDQRNGTLSLAGHQPCLGRTPRNFNFDPSGNYLLVANQNSDDIVVFSIDHRTGLLSDTGKRIWIGSPVCVKWIEKE